MAAPRNSADIWAIHQPAEDTPQIMTPKVSAKMIRIATRVPVNSTVATFWLPLRKYSSLSSLHVGHQRLGRDPP